jgi:hypothetical protein
LMPKLDEVLSNELAQTGEQDGFEMFRQLVRKLDPPKADVAFDLKAEIEVLGKHVCSNFAQCSDSTLPDHARHSGQRLCPGNRQGLPSRLSCLSDAPRH